MRDTYELALREGALARDLPLLAICRGAQVLNVAAGGTLIQDIPSACPGAIRHRVDMPRNGVAHDVAVAPGTWLADAARQPPVGGLPRRRQQPAPSVRQATSRPAFVVSATAPDGVVEAIEKPGAPFCVGVQWHPENFWTTGEFAGLFRGLVKAARAAHPPR